MLVNIRDLGGIKAAEGKVIKEKHIYRSGVFILADNEENEYLKKLGVNTLFDYRGDKNFGKGFDFAKKAYSISASNHLPTVERFNNSHKLNAQESFELMCDYYKLLPFNNPAYKNMVELLKKPDTAPILQSCTAGKDRTGVGTIILLWILGVSKEDIYKDYLETQRNLHEIIVSDLELLYRKYDNETVKDVFAGRLKNDLQTKVEFIDTLYEEVEKTYGNIDNYLEKEFNLTIEDIKTIREYYLE